MEVSDKLKQDFTIKQSDYTRQTIEQRERQQREQQERERKFKINEQLSRVFGLAEKYATHRIPMNLNDAETREYFSDWRDIEPFEDKGFVQAKINKTVRVKRDGTLETSTKPFLVTIDLRIRDKDNSFETEEDNSVAVFNRTSAGAWPDGFIKFPKSEEDALSPDTEEWDKMVEFLDTVEAAFNQPITDPDHLLQ